MLKFAWWYFNAKILIYDYFLKAVEDLVEAVAAAEAVAATTATKKVILPENAPR